MDGMTLSEMSKGLNVPVNTLRQRITRLRIKPITKEAIYSRADFEKIRNVEMGRPKKELAPEPAKPREKKPAKAKRGRQLTPGRDSGLPRTFWSILERPKGRERFTLNDTEEEI
jgi:hypothetical protein